MSGQVNTIHSQHVSGFWLGRLFSRRWLLATLLVLAGTGVLARLGIWQLDRLEGRRAFNARAQAQISQPALELSGSAAAVGLDLAAMEYRPVVVRGVYDFSQQVALRNQVKGNEAGVSLLTPLKIEGTDATILVERGWVPGIDADPAGWRQYDQQGVVEVHGMLRASRSQPDFGQRADALPVEGGEGLLLWYFANVEAIGQQLSYPILAAYVQQAPDPAWTGLPYRSLPELDLSEGPHMSYALQWFSFAGILFFGYPFFVRKREMVRSLQ